MSGVGLTADIAKRALLTQQIALQVVGHNIANVNTPGFSRQKAVLEPSDPVPSDVGLIGSGVKASSITQAYNKYVEAQISAEIEGLGKWEAKNETFERIEAVFNESLGYGLNNAMNEFWNAWQDVANNPVGKAQRITLIAKGQTVTTTLNDLYTNLTQVQKDLDSSITGTVGDINTIADQIADLNHKIQGAEISGAQANDYRDARANLVHELSKKIDINYYENSDGTLAIMVGQGRLLVDGKSSWDLQCVANTSNDNFVDVKWDPGNGTDLADITSNISGGKLAGWVELRDVTIDDYIDKLNTLAQEIVEEVNRLHSDGVGLTGYSTITAANAVNAPTNALNSSGLSFTPVDGSFTVYVYDSSGTITDSGTVTIDADVTTLNGVDTDIDAISNITGSISNGLLTITADSGYTFTFLSDDSDVLVALGINTFFTGNSASTIDINSVVESDSNKIAAATSNSSPGDNSNALAIAALKDSLLLESGATTLGDYYSSLVSEIGVESSKASSTFNHQELMVNQLENRRSSISGVSLDEEMVDLIRYQNAYIAATRLISIVDEMLKAVVGMV